MNTRNERTPAINAAANDVEATLHQIRGIAAVIRCNETVDPNIGNAAWAIEHICSHAQDLLDALVGRACS